MTGPRDQDRPQVSDSDGGAAGFDRAEMQRLMADWCNGGLLDEDAARVDELLATRPEARQMYLEYATTEAELHAAVAGVSGPAFTDAALSGPAAPRPKSRLLTAWSSSGGVAALALAASLLLAVTVGVVQSTRGSIETTAAEAGGASSALAAAAEHDSVARITATRNCRWGGGRGDLGYGSALRAKEQVRLDAGLAEIRFNDGAIVVLEGPAVLRLGSADAPESAVLLSGRLAATAPAGDGRLPATTERLGVTLASLEPSTGGSAAGGSAARGGAAWASQYGLSADGRLGDEVHVFGGSIEAFLRGVDGDADGGVPVTLRRQEAGRLGPASTTVAKFFADRDKFVRSIAATGGPQDGLYAYESFDYPGGPLGGQNGGFGWAGAWADIEAACPPGEIATNVAEPGNLLREGVRAIGGRAVQRAQQNRVRRVLSTSLGGVFDSAGLVENQDGHRLVGSNGKTVYLSFLQRTDRTDDVFYGLELHRGDGNGNRVLCVGNGADGAGYGVTSNYNSYGEANYGRLGEEDTEANFIVVRIDFGPQNRDTVTVYRNPISLLEEHPAEAVTRLRGNFAFDRIGLGNFEGQKLHEVDEVRIGTTYRAATGRRDRGGERLEAPLASGRVPTTTTQPTPLAMVARGQTLPL